MHRANCLKRFATTRTSRPTAHLATRHGRPFSTIVTHLEPLPPPQSANPNILLVKKPNDSKVNQALGAIVTHLLREYPKVNLLREPTDTTSPSKIALWSKDTNVDLVITLGGDGTILHASSLFKEGPVPPVLSFSLGTLGFLLPFHIDNFPKALDEFFGGHSTVLHRMRLSYRFKDAADNVLPGQGAFGFQVMNEVTLHRGRSPHLNIVDAFIDGQHLTEAVSDGLIISTPTGSTAYSLSSGGPIVHPTMRALLLTPICPRSLSFRPLIFPGTSRIRLRISEKSRAPAEVSTDGQEARILQPGESIEMEASPFPIPCINRSLTKSSERYNPAPGGEGQDGWVRDINKLLRFNASFKSISTAHFDID